MTMILTELTPEMLRCAVGPCPSVFETDRGTFIVIGKVVQDEEALRLLRGKIGEGESAVELPRAFFNGVKP